MTEQERIEGINSEQLATATDRVLLAARFGRARPSSPHLYGRASSPQLAQGSQCTRLPQPSFAHGYALAQPAPGFARGSQPHLYSNDAYVPQSDAPLYAPQKVPTRESSTEIRRGRNDEHTVFTRRPKHYEAAWSTFAKISLVTSLISVAAAIALLV